MGWLSNFVSNPIDTVLGTVEKVGDAVTEDPVKTAALAAAAYYGYGAFTESGTALAASAEGGSVALAPVYDAVAVPVSEIAPWAGASSNSAFEAALANSGYGASSGWTAGQIASTTASGLNLATSGVKLAALGKSMNATQATSTGLTGALAPTTIQTPSGLITTTPQGPVVAGPVASSGGFLGMDTQTLFVIAAAAAGIYYLVKHHGK